MAFNGTLLHLGLNNSSAEFPLKYVYKDSYNAYINVQDIDSTRTELGELDRNVLDHTATTISFQAKPMWSEDFNKMMKAINDAYISPWKKDRNGNKLINTERKLNLYYYVPEFDIYLSGKFYLAQPQPPIMQIDGNRIRYGSFTIEFIEY